MADCPLCDDWHYDPFGSAAFAWVPGNPVTPVVWDGERARVAGCAEAPEGYSAAVGAHICFDHPASDLARSVGPVQRSQPAFPAPPVPVLPEPRRPWWKRLLPL